MLLALFVALRAANVYGDPEPWSARAQAWRSAASFVEVTKYPPSLTYVLLTLGAAGLLLAALDRERPGPVLRALAVFGRVPLFFYVTRLVLLHTASALVYQLEIGRPLRLFETFVQGFPAGYGHGLLVVYAAWIACLALLWLPCRPWRERARCATRGLSSSS